PADMADQIIEIRMEHRFAPAEGDNRRSKRLERIDTAEHDVGRHRRRDFVVFVAVAAVDIAAAYRDDLNEKGMRRVYEAAPELFERACFTTEDPVHRSSKYNIRPRRAQPDASFACARRSSVSR